MASLPGRPVNSPNLPTGVAPVAWFAVADSQLPRPPVARIPIPSTRRITPHQLRFHLVNPVGPSLAAIPLLVSPLARGRSSGSGWHALAGTKESVHGSFLQVKGYFRIHRVIHHIARSSPEILSSSTVHPHGCAQARRDRCGTSALTFAGERGTMAAMTSGTRFTLASIIIIR
jgi:hypothetical protein